MREHTQPAVEDPVLGAEWFDPLEDAVRQRIRRFIEAMVESELEAALGRRSRYGRQGNPSDIATAAGNGSW